MAGEIPSEVRPDKVDSSVPDPQLEALGAKVFGEHEHVREYAGPHYRKEDTWFEIGDRTPSEEEMQQRRSQPRVVGVEIREARERRRGTDTTVSYIVTTRLVDLWSLADEKAWQQEMAEKYLIQGNIGRYRSSLPGSAGRGLSSRGWPTVEAGCAHMTMLMGAPDGDMFHADVHVCEGDPKLLEHEFERKVLRNGNGIRAEDRQRVVKYVSHDEGGQGAFWSTGSGVYVSIVAERYPREVIGAYLKKHPSHLTKDYRVDEARWIDAEIAYRFRWMDQALALDDRREARNRFSQQVTLFLEDFKLPITEADARDLESCQQARKHLAGWWEANNGKLRWNQKTRKFEVKE